MIRRNLWLALSVLLLTTLACQPVIVIGWNEFLVVFLLFTVLLGPLIYRFLRRVEGILRRRQQNKEQTRNSRL